MTTNNDHVWKPDQERILANWKAKTFINLWLHTYSIYYYERLYDLLTYPIIIISVANSVTIFTTNNKIINIFVGVLIMCNVFLTKLAQQINPGILIQQHNILYRKYLNLVRNIDTCLSLSPDMRPHPTLFLEKIMNEINTLADVPLNAPNYILNRFERKYGVIDQLLYSRNIHDILQLKMKHKKMMNRAKRKSQILTPNKQKTTTTENGSVAITMNESGTEVSTPSDSKSS